MGKNSVIESLSRLIANTIVHNILIGKTSKPEAVNHLESEEIEYRAQAIKKSGLYHWNNEDVARIKEEIKKKIENKFKNKYTDVIVPKDKIKELIDTDIKDLLKKK
ncbi:MAG: hypothetical protein AABX73_02465 [Nanoarchaeota archaeon]